MAKKVSQIIDEINELLRHYPTSSRLFKRIINWEEYVEMVNYINSVLVGRLRFNDHGLMHALIVTRNAIKMSLILKSKNWTFNIENEGFNFEDALNIIILSSLFHDFGNIINRKYHQFFSLVITGDMIMDVLDDFYSKTEARKILANVFSCIVTHQGDVDIPAMSIEAKVVAIADGLDMEEGRARNVYKIGDRVSIHIYSAMAIKKVKILEGSKKPIRVEIEMADPSGLFQIENVLNKKINEVNGWDIIDMLIKVRSHGDVLIVEDGIIRRVGRMGEESYKES